MKVMVLLKQTPDTEAAIKIAGDGKSIDESGMKFVVNPYDEFAVEEAIQIKTKAGSGEVVVVSFGADGVKERMIKALAMGGDRAILVSNAGLENADSLTIAKVLAAVAKEENPDVVLCGRQGIDDDNMHVGVMVAELMGRPHANVVSKLEIADGSAKVEREVEGGQTEVYDVKLPAVFGADKSLNEPRYTSLPGIMKAKKKPFDKKAPSDFGLDAGSLGGQIKTVISGYQRSQF